MKAYSIFDDFDKKAIEILEKAKVDLTVHPSGMLRPNDVQMQSILEKYDCVIIGTSQKINTEMFENITTSKIIATASVGVDHIAVPDNKKELVTILNTPTANAQSVAEFTIGTALNCIKRLSEGKELYLNGKNNKALSRKPEDLYGKIMGIIGAGNISVKIMEYAQMLGMKVFYWTAHPENYELPYEYRDIKELVALSDVISVNIPNNSGTRGLISADLIGMMKPDCVFISVSRLAIVDLLALVDKAQTNENFYVNLDIDVDRDVIELIQNVEHVSVTPHIAGGTIETRKRMFIEVAEKIAKLSV